MKKILIILVIAWCPAFLLPTQAQTNTLKPHSDLKNEIGADAGPFSMFGGLLVGTVNFFNAVGNELSHKGYKAQYYGSYGVHYYRQVTHWCQVGARFTVEGGRHTRYTDTLCTTIQSVSHDLIFTIMPSVRFTYLNRPWVRLYSGADFGLGYLYSNVKEMTKDGSDDSDGNRFFPAFNVNVFGVNVGKKFYGLFELNAGFDAMIKFGIGARF